MSVKRWAKRFIFLPRTAFQTIFRFTLSESGETPPFPVERYGFPMESFLEKAVGMASMSYLCERSVMM